MNSHQGIRDTCNYEHGMADFKSQQDREQEQSEHTQRILAAVGDYRERTGSRQEKHDLTQ